MTPQELILNELKERYGKATLSKAELAHEMGVSYSTIDNYIRLGYGVPDFKKIGKSKNGKILFTIVDVALFLSQTTKTA